MRKTRRRVGRLRIRVSRTGSSRQGVIPVDKSPGPTSHDIVRLARRALDTRRIGHTGTLDPFASGLLLLCVGRATRLSEYLSRLPKTYIATIRFGSRTDTLDSTGSVVAESDAWRELSAGAVREALADLEGDQLQVPPVYSAKKVDGERLHRRARRGESVAPEAVPVTIHRLEVLDVSLPDVRIEVECSSGTYVRSIARDAGQLLVTEAHLFGLRRTRIGEFRVEDAIGTNALEAGEDVEGALIDPLTAVGHFPQLDVDGDDAADLLHGREIAVPETGLPDGPVALALGTHLLAIGEVEGERLRPRKVFPLE